MPFSYTYAHTHTIILSSNTFICHMSYIIYVICHTLPHTIPQILQQMGFQVAATPGTAEFYASRGIVGITPLSKPTDEAGVTTPMLAASETALVNQGTVLEWIRDKVSQ
jgi:hypothetical protein